MIFSIPVRQCSLGILGEYGLPQFMTYLFERVVTTKLLEELFDVIVAQVLVKKLVMFHIVFRKCVDQFGVELYLELGLGHLRHTGFGRIAHLIIVHRFSVFRKTVDEGVTWRWGGSTDSLKKL